MLLKTVLMNAAWRLSSLLLRTRSMCRVGPSFEESLDDDESTLLTDGVDDLDNDDDEDDATTGSIQVDSNVDEDEDRDYNLDDDAYWPGSSFYPTF
ncbi:hypothetical protein HAX54_039503 [Datura stramonium]|uniref:Uncharacterized protein n=1 Tax=Datura stramonium TaxID=4076 RepID=A0ABS8VPJ2_DATST|nr:hypothetical protein [Datura stramonium]